MTAPDLLTTDDVSSLLHVPPATLRQWRHQGRGPRSFKLGALVRYERADVLEWLRQQYDQTAKGASA